MNSYAQGHYVSEQTGSFHFKFIFFKKIRTRCDLGGYLIHITHF